MLQWGLESGLCRAVLVWMIGKRFACVVLGDRKSKRARKGRAPIKVSALETIHELKLKVVQTLSIHPQNAALHIYQAGGWQLVTDDSATLAGKLCFPSPALLIVTTVMLR